MIWLWLYLAGCACVPGILGYFGRGKTTGADVYERPRAWLITFGWPVFIAVGLLYSLGEGIRAARDKIAQRRAQAAQRQNGGGA